MDTNTINDSSSINKKSLIKELHSNMENKLLLANIKIWVITIYNKITFNNLLLFIIHVAKLIYNILLVLLDSNIYIKCEKIYNDSIIPIKATNKSVGFDLFADDDTTIMELNNSIIPTGIKIMCPDNIHCEIRGRSGLALKGLIVHNGLIDNDYTDEIKVILYNYCTNSMIKIKRGDKIAQLVFYGTKGRDVVFIESKLAECTHKGFGSTDIKSDDPEHNGSKKYPIVDILPSNRMLLTTPFTAKVAWDDFELNPTMAQRNIKRKKIYKFDDKRNSIREVIEDDVDNDVVNNSDQIEKLMDNIY